MIRDQSVRDRSHLAVLPAVLPAEPRQDRLLTEILDLIEVLRDKAERHVSFHSAWADEAARSENFDALAWMQVSLEDLAATAVGISRSSHPGVQVWEPVSGIGA